MLVVTKITKSRLRESQVIPDIANVIAMVAGDNEDHIKTHTWKLLSKELIHEVFHMSIYIERSQFIVLNSST
jgi:hypothetical protein